MLIAFAIWYLVILIAIWIVFYGIYQQKFFGFLKGLLTLIGSISIYGLVYSIVEIFTDTKFLTNTIFYLGWLVGIIGVFLYILGIRLINREKIAARQKNQ